MAGGDENALRKTMTQYLSISCLPFPTFIEGGYATFEVGEQHPNRDDLQYFILMVMRKGCLFIAEDDAHYTIKAGQIFVLRPRHHHYSWKPVAERTEYYWLHFYVAGEWSQSVNPTPLTPSIAVPTLHYYTPSTTVYLAKQFNIPNQDQLMPTIRQIFEESQQSNSYGFWRSQQLFIDVLQAVQYSSAKETRLAELAAHVQEYLRTHYQSRITNEELSRVFHFHPNYISRAVKQTTGLTPDEFVKQYRMEEAKRQLLNTSLSISTIAERVGYQNIYYFSTSFKKQVGVSPRTYRING